VWLLGAAGAEAGCHRIVTEEAVYISLPDCPADGLGLIFLINEISWRCFIRYCGSGSEMRQRGRYNGNKGKEPSAQRKINQQGHVCRRMKIFDVNISREFPYKEIHVIF